MPTWNEVNSEIDQLGSTTACDEIRKKYILKLEKRVERNVIAYYSGFLQKRNADGSIHPECAISDLDMNGFMAVVHDMDRTRGLDLVLHTPGGGVEAGRAIVEYLYKMFDSDIRVIVPHMAMSVGTMIACASKEIIMGKHSCLGPTDPQVKGYPALGILAEVDKSIVEIRKEPMKQIIFQQIFAKYPPAFISDCERAVQHSKEMVKGWLAAGMFKDFTDPESTADAAISALMDYEGTAEHSHHFLIDHCRDIGLNVSALEDDQKLQEDVLSVHHAFVATFARMNAIKIVQNANGGIWTVGA
ncbi:SDH family Clp fold serine proteinase [Celeribacter sp.]|uniref:SDH family Clp fold serine proteinase n=1 Tax=Celeribacter sp. TaxID=1890673 RepID=UPI003A9138E1